MMKANKGGKFNKTHISRIIKILMLCLALSATFATASYAESCPKGGEHDYSVKLVKQASNTEDGLRTFTCKKCGHSYDEVIPNFGHEWSEWSVKVAPQCNRTGIEERHCLKCDASEERKLDSLGHDWGEWRREGNNEVRVCRRNSNHIEKRAVTIEAEVKEEDKEEPEEEKKEEPEEVKIEELPAPVISNTDATPPGDSDGSRGGSLEWTGANTAVAAGGSLILAGLGALLFTGYITPWLWVLGKRRKKREEMQRRAYS